MNFKNTYYSDANLCVLLLMFFGAHILIKSQRQDTLKSTFNYTLKSEYGTLMNTNAYVENLPSKNYSAYSFQVTLRPKIKNDWEVMYRDPNYGLGIYYIDFLKNKQMGYPFSVYGFFNNKIASWNRFSWDYNVNLGVAFNVNPYDQSKGYNNVSFGSKTNLYIGVGAMMRYALSAHFDLGLGFGINHLSNGSLKWPNKGLNFGAPQLSLTYHPERKLPNNILSEKQNKDRFQAIELSVFGGRKNVFYRGEGRDLLPSFYVGFNYYIYGLEGLYVRQFNRKSAYGLALGVTYDGNYNHTMYIENQILKQRKRFINEHILPSVLPTYRLMMGKVLVNIQAGYYPTKKVRDYDDSRFFQRIGLQYQFSDRVFASFGINAYDFHRANFLEWKLGYVLSKSKIKS